VDARHKAGHDEGMDASIPPELQAALDRLAHGKSGRELTQRAEAISQLFRASAGSREAIRNADDALAYAFTRLPATYAAASAALAALSDSAPEFAPRSLIDAGAGPGTATWAAAAQFAMLADVRLIDDNRHLRALGLRLLDMSTDTALRGARYDAGDLVALARGAAPADLVIASYAIGELAPDALAHAADALWAATADVLVVVEPGTPAGFARIRALRAHLIAQGAHALAPCPHAHACPIVDPDWCHFVQRLPRSRSHRHVKGADLSYEDEKFSYVALARDRKPAAGARVLAHPRVGKVAASAKLCTPDGRIVTATAARRERAGYASQKRWRWGDRVTWPDTKGDGRDPQD
jgi:ribosomal protein RSM22 (predicted rRNA methylase)